MAKTKGVRTIRHPRLLFMALLAAGCAAHCFDDTKILGLRVTSPLFCLEYMIYFGLIMGWMQSVHRRLLPIRARGYILSAAGLMLFFLLLQATKYRTAGSALLKRELWYMYYIPICTVPTLFLMSAVSMAGGPRLKWDERLLLVPAGLLALGVWTNDLHKLAFLPVYGLENLTGNQETYSYGILYYAVCAWGSINLAAGILLLMKASGRLREIKSAMFPFLYIALIPLLEILEKRTAQSLWTTPEILIFCMLGFLEACIHNRLIPHNENYGEVFRRISLPAWITDRKFRPRYQTEAAKLTEPAEMRKALQEPVYPEENERLSGRRIQGGYAFWLDDEHVIRHTSEMLEEANETLAMENEILERDQELQREKQSVEARNRLYARAARAVYPAQKRIEALLGEAGPGTALFRDQIADILVWTAYVKRKSNFILLEAEREQITREELLSALRESAHYYRYLGLKISVSAEREGEYPLREAMEIYDAFQTIAEALRGRTGDLWIRLKDEETLMMADGADISGIPEPDLPVTVKTEDDQIVIRMGREGKRS